MIPSWDYKTGFVRSQPSRRTPRQGRISRPSSSTPTSRSRRTPRPQTSNRPEQEPNNDFPSQSEIRESPLTSGVPPGLNFIDPALLTLAVNVNQPPQTIGALALTTADDLAPNPLGPIFPPDQRGNGLDPPPAPWDGPGIEGGADDAIFHEFLNVDEDETRA